MQIGQLGTLLDVMTAQCADIGQVANLAIN